MQPLTANGLRQCLRIAIGATCGFVFAKVFGFQYGVFFTVVPMLLLGMVPVMNLHAARQLLAAGVVCALEVGIIGGLLGSHPILVTLVAFVLFLYRFICMAKGPLFLFGANGVLMLSILLHFASYPSTNVNDLLLNNLLANVLSIAVAFVLTVILPDVEPRPAAPQAPAKTSSRIRHEALLGAIVCTLAFIAFQSLDLKDSMSAQATMILVLFPMNWYGAIAYARRRAIGTILGVVYGLAAQALLYSWSHQLLLLVPLFWIGVLIFARLHVREANGAGVGFGALTTLGILFGQYLTPTSDLVFSGLYRVSSTLAAIVIAMTACFALHHLLNRFPATRFGD
ncbi:1,4-alpha-glucan branching protein [Idiomarina tyrosinivorans]|uniref:1,4-alpha-glucan branching protein n=1 Tax=Idiomarina tyrosinivorans TaxID=1445662 RepID=A0A432ZQJ3_9GAMM|nr:DUF2955 domain-containing protein [Idiomarina tyrosinivorans]RUO80153.1 1,4-alpha-glucan branching protein [Idiomarina tyrosinivorans]